MKQIVYISAVFVLSACSNRLVDANYSYSYMPETETYLSLRRSIGEIYAFDPSDPDGRLVKFDRSVQLQSTDLTDLVPVSATTSRVTGADMTITLTNGNSIGGSSEFQALIEADALSISSARASVVSDRIEALYAALRAEQPDAELPLRAREIDSGELVYAVISGAGDADKVELRHGTPNGSDGSGFSVTVAGQTILDVDITNTSFFTCEKVGSTQPKCTVDISVYSGKLKRRGDAIFFDVSPTSVEKTAITRAFQNTFTN